MDTSPAEDLEGSGSRRLMILLAAAMFVLVVDTSLMNVSISAVITDLDTTASGVQSAIALEVVIIAVVLTQIGLVRDVPYTGSRQVDVVGASSLAASARAEGTPPQSASAGPRHNPSASRSASAVLAG